MSLLLITPRLSLLIHSRRLQYGEMEVMAGLYLFEDLLAQASGPGVLSVALPADGQALLLAQVGPLAVLGGCFLGARSSGCWISRHFLSN